jgi:hypothetical protein
LSNFDRYRDLTQKADSALGSQYGYGRNVYIDNRDDFEKVSNGTGYVRLTTPQLHRLWQRKSFQLTGASAGNIAYTGAAGAIGPGANAFRLAFPRLGAIADTYVYPSPMGSLEQRAIRGWVSPWEYRPRGVTIDLRGNSILITRDDRSETAGTNVDFSKSWKSPDGGDLAAGLTNRVFRMRIDLATSERFAVVDEASPGVFNETPIPGTNLNTPFDGVIFAEGNVRVRGWYGSNIAPLFTPAKPLTIVSGNNIYVDGSLRQQSNQKISLIAKQNVVLNPGQFTPRSAGVGDADIADADEAAVAPRQQIVLTAALNSNAAEISCTPQDANTTLNFKIGDRIVVGTFPEVLTVTRVVPTTGRVTIRTPISSTIASLSAVPLAQANVGARVRLLHEAPVVKGNDSTLFPAPTQRTNEYFYRLSRPWHAFARDVRLKMHFQAEVMHTIFNTMAGDE